MHNSHLEKSKRNQRIRRLLAAGWTQTKVAEEYSIKARIKDTRTISYRKYGVPAIIIEGKWLKDIYGLSVGDHINVAYEPDEIKLSFKKSYPEDKDIKII